MIGVICFIETFTKIPFIPSQDRPELTLQLGAEQSQVTCCTCLRVCLPNLGSPDRSAHPRAPNTRAPPPGPSQAAVCHRVAARPAPRGPGSEDQSLFAARRGTARSRSPRAKAPPRLGDPSCPALSLPLLLHAARAPFPPPRRPSLHPAAAPSPRPAPEGKGPAPHLLAP